MQHQTNIDWEIVMEDDEPPQIEIVLPRARSIVWLGLKVYLIVILGAWLLWMAAMLLGVALVAAMR
jgi:hypothetical protein